jgi:ubiquinone/menaquinone biosynthesis C-methylase UbiE
MPTSNPPAGRAPTTRPTRPSTDPLDTGIGSSFDHGAISRFNAWFFTAFSGYINRVSRHHKQRAFEGLSASAVLELGAGTGANLDYLSPGTELYGLEPNRRMHPRLRARCAAAGIDLTLLPCGGEAIPLADGSIDEVICSLVLCSVDDPGQVLREVHRVLRPGGRFRFVEHVASPRRGPRQVVQRAIRRPWGWLFEGCSPTRSTLATIEAAGFRDVRAEHRKLRRSLFWPVNTAVHGIATR